MRRITAKTPNTGGPAHVLPCPQGLVYTEYLARCPVCEGALQLREEMEMTEVTVVFLPPLNREPRVYHVSWYKVRNEMLVMLEGEKTIHIPLMSILYFTTEAL